MNPTPLLGLTMLNDDYHKDTSRISKSGLDQINKTPAHYYYRYLDPNKKPEAAKEWQVVGSATGASILEPDTFNDQFTVLQDAELRLQIGGDRPTATKQYKEWLAAELARLEGKKILTAEEYSLCIAMRDAAHKHAGAKFLLKNGQAERTFYFTDPSTGAECRIRPDWLAPFIGWAVDVKTTPDASPEHFWRSVSKFRYHVQDPFYTDGLKHNGLPLKGFAFIVIEKTYPHHVATYFLPKEAIERGRGAIQRNLETYTDCLEKNKWPGYGDLLTELPFPAYALKDL